MNKQTDLLVMGNWDADSVSVRVHGTHVPSPDALQYAENVWKEAIQIHPTMFNGPMVRLKSWKVGKTLELEMEQTDFLFYLATREPSFEDRFPTEKRADPQGMNIVVMTSDNKIVTTRRSLTSEQNPGTLNFIGGYLNPPNEGSSSINLANEAKREMEEELNIPGDSVVSLEVHGLGYDPVHCHPELFLVARVSVTGHFIKEHWQNARDANEANQVMLIDTEELIRRNEENTLPYPPCWSFRIGMFLL